MTKMHVLTLFPEMIRQGLNLSVIGRAMEKGIISLNAVNIRDYTLDRHGRVDDYPYGGGAGMLMQAQPVYDAHRAVTGGRPVRTVYLTPQGIPFTQKMARELAAEDELVFLCGHYEGIDERVLEKVVTDYVSIGDYVLTGGELPAMVMIDAIARLIPGVLGNDTSAEEESFYNGLLEYPHYSRPEIWQGESVPKVLLTGNHSLVAAWRLEQSRRRTADRRPDLYGRYLEKQRIIQELSREKRNNIHMMESLRTDRGEILYAAGGSILLYDSESELCMAKVSESFAAEKLTVSESAEAEGMTDPKISGAEGMTDPKISGAEGMTDPEISEAEKLSKRIPDKARWLVVSQGFLRDRLAGQGYRVTSECHQVLYTQREVLPVRRKCIRQLGAEDLENVFACCRDSAGGRTACVEERLLAGAMYGAFAEGELAGFAGVHRAGNLGMLFVVEKWRRQGFGESLVAFAANRMLEKGQTPYGYIIVGEEASRRMLEKLKFYTAKKSFWWLEKVLANKECIC